MELAQRAKVEIHERIAVEYQHRLSGKMRLCLLKPSPRPQNNWFGRIDNPQPIPRAIAQRLLNHRPEVMQINDDIVEPVPLQQQEIPYNQRRACDGEKRLRNRIRQRPQASPQARCEDHGLHIEVLSV